MSYFSFPSVYVHCKLTRRHWKFIYFYRAKFMCIDISTIFCSIETSNFVEFQKKYIFLRLFRKKVEGTADRMKKMKIRFIENGREYQYFVERTSERANERTIVTFIFLLDFLTFCRSTSRWISC